MRFRLMTSLLIVGLASASAMAAPQTNSRSEALKSRFSAQQKNVKPVDVDKVSYAIGFTMGSNLQRQFEDLKSDQLIKGFKSGLAGEKGQFTKQEMQTMLMQFQRQAMQQRIAKMKKVGETNKVEGEKFLEANKGKPGVVTLPSGLQYKVIKKGSGMVPTDQDQVKVKYTGKLINGDVFSSSDEFGDKPASFSLKGVIPAWREALKLMKQGSTWEIYVPSKLAYGARGTRGKIGPNSTLIFTIELVDVEKNAVKKKQVNRVNDRFPRGQTR